MMPKKRQGTDSLPFKKILKQIMEDRELTIKLIGEMSGVSTSVAQSWLEGSTPHDLHAVARLAKALNMSFKGLLLGEPEGSGQITAAELFEEQDFFDGICKISIKRLLPRKRGK